MGQKAKYTENQLLDAVIEFSQVENGKIFLPRLVGWARNNLPGMEGVCEHHFKAKRKVVNSVTGKVSYVHIQAFDRIKQLNLERKGIASARKNVLLHSSDIDEFLRLPPYEQRKQILKTRSLYEGLLQSNLEYKEKNDMLQAENKDLRLHKTQNEERFSVIEEILETEQRKIDSLIKKLDREQGRNALKEIGIEGEKVDLKKYIESRQDGLSNIFAKIGKMKGTAENSKLSPSIDDIMGGLDL